MSSPPPLSMFAYMIRMLPRTSENRDMAEHWREEMRMLYACTGAELWLNASRQMATEIGAHFDGDIF